MKKYITLTLIFAASIGAIAQNSFNAGTISVRTAGNSFTPPAYYPNNITLQSNLVVNGIIYGNGSGLSNVIASVTNSTSFTNLNGSSMTNVSIYNSFITNSTIAGSIVSNSLVTGTFIGSGTISNSIYANNAVLASNIISGAANGTIQGQMLITNSALNGSTLGNDSYDTLTGTTLNANTANINTANISNAVVGIITNNNNFGVDNVGNLYAGTLNGDGSGIGDLNAGQLAHGTVPDARLSGNVPLISASTNTFSGTIIGNFMGNGSQLTGVSATNLIVQNSRLIDLDHPIQKLSNVGGQGVATGPTNYYSCGTLTLTTTTFNDVPMGLSNLSLSNGIPTLLNHSGGIAYANAQIFVPITYYVSGAARVPTVGSNSIVAIFSAVTNGLPLISWFYVSNQVQSCSCVTVNTNLGIIYVGDYSSLTNVAMYDYTTHAFLGYKTLSQPSTGLQGIAAKNGYLYCTANLCYNGGNVFMTFNETNGQLAYPLQILSPNPNGEPEGISYEGTNLIFATGSNGRGCYVFAPEAVTTNLAITINNFDASGGISLGSSVSSELSRNPTSDGLVLYYPFYETKGSLIHDFSPSHINGASSMTNTSEFLGISGYGLYLDGTTTANAGVAIPNDLKLSGLTNITIEVWFYCTNTFASARTLISKYYQNPYGEWFLNMNTDTQVRWCVQWTNLVNRTDLIGNIPSVVSSPTNIVWHMMACTYSSILTNQVIYLDGIAVTNAQNPSTAIGSCPEQGIVIGTTGFNGSATWNGGEDEVSIYKRAKSASEILADYNTLSPLKNFKLLPPTSTSNPTNQYLVSTLYTNASKGRLVGSFVLNPTVGAASSIVINYTNNSIGYSLPAYVPAGSAVKYVFPFSIDFSTNSTFIATTNLTDVGLAYLTNTVYWITP